MRRLLRRLFRFLVPHASTLRPADDARRLGRQAERLAARALRRAGLRVLARNYRCPAGEIDIVARDGNVLVFVEVKARRDDPEAPAQALSHAKRHRLTRLARYYLGAINRPDAPARFDVVTVVFHTDRPPQVHHYPHAFDAIG